MTRVRAWSAAVAPVVLGASLALGIAARVRQYVGCPSYWYDEAYLLLNIFDRSFSDLIGQLDYQVVAPPLFLWILRGLYEIAGGSEWTMRLPAALSSMLSLFVMIPLARRFVGHPGWMWAVALCAVSNHALIHGNEVRPYAGDFLIAEAILLATYAYIASDVATHGHWLFAGLISTAALAPWLSFPSTFVLGGVSLALLKETIRRRSRTWCLRWLGFNGVVCLSGIGLWYFAARHLYYPGLREHWTKGWNGFPTGYSPLTTLSWAIQAMIGIGNYGTTGMGIPLLLLATLGGIVLWNRSRSVSMLLVGPLLLAIFAAILRLYPLGDRTLFFLVPYVWLSATVGIGVLLRGKFAWVGAVILVVLLLPGALRMSKSVVAVQPKVDYRAAFRYVHDQWQSGDRLWVAQPEVHDVYFGHDPLLLGYYTPPQMVAETAQSSRLWIIFNPPGPGKNAFSDLSEQLKEVHSTEVAHHRVKGLEIILFVPPCATTSAEKP